ncbi:MAG TPA: hypothetical protein VK914_02440 [bacterium]|jgi:hypothetical protein|nr:hypothetical protein [bacterium]
MVRSLALAALLLAAQCPAGAQTDAAPLSPSAPPRAAAKADSATAQELPLLPKRPQHPKLQNPSRWEYITVVTLLSAPFTVLWYGLAVGAVESVAQRRLPPKFNSGLYAGVGAAALGTSLGIALFSVSWGRQGKDSAQPEALSPTASGAPEIPSRQKISAQGRPEPSHG